MDQRIHRHNRADGLVGEGQRTQVANLKTEPRSEPSRLSDHGRRDVDPANDSTTLVQVSGNVSRATPKVTDQAISVRGNVVEQRPINGLPVQLMKHASCVLGGDAVITLGDAFPWIHG